MKLIISLTSYPPRIHSVHKVIESLYVQTVHADKIILYLSEDEFPHLEADLPHTLKKQIGRHGFNIQWVNGNLRSHKKYYYALQEYKEDVVITVDDDKIYAPSMVAELVETWKYFPKAISARRARIILRNEEGLEKYVRWDSYLDEYANMPRMDLCAIGVGGICYGPGCAGESWFDKKLFMAVAKDQDDLWLKYNETITGIPIIYAGALQEDITIEHSQVHCLAARNMYQHENDRCIEQLVMLMKDYDQKQYEMWYENLIRREDYIIRKKKYYNKIFQEMIEQAGDIPLYLYGVGREEKYLLRALADFGLAERIKYMIVSDKEGCPSKIRGVEVHQLCEIDISEKFGIIFCVDEKEQYEVEKELKECDYQCIRFDVPNLIQYIKSKKSWC